MRDDSALLSLLRQRDQKGVEELSLRYGPLMRYIIAPILPDPGDREECLSDVILLVWERIALYDPEKGGFSAWLTALTRNTALNRARKQIRKAGELSPDHPSPDPGPEELAMRRELLEALKKALDSLPQRDRVLFYRKYYYMQPTAQIAAELGITERAAEGRLYRLKKRLRKELGGMMGP